MVTFPPCKINLGLYVVGKRGDGYHDIATCFYPVPWTDVLEIVRAAQYSFHLSGAAVPGPAADNLCVRAYELLRRDFSLAPVTIHLHKVIPIGAGLGGGSADGAYALKTLNALFGLGLSTDVLRSYAARLGSDCAFFIDERPAIGTGRGEILTPVNVSLKGKFLVIVKPEVQISTARAFAGVTPRSTPVDLKSLLGSKPVQEWQGMLDNDFHPTIFRDFPIVEGIYQRIAAAGALYASMSGSGSAVYGIFDNAVSLEREFADTDYWSGYLP